MKKLIAFWEKLKIKWDIKSDFDAFLICVVFAFAGSSVLVVADFIYNLLGISENVSTWTKVIVRIVLVFPAYQLLLLTYGLFLGQFKFFWGKEKKMGKWLLNIFNAGK